MFTWILGVFGFQTVIFRMTEGFFHLNFKIKCGRSPKIGFLHCLSSEVYGWKSDIFGFWKVIFRGTKRLLAKFLDQMYKVWILASLTLNRSFSGWQRLSSNLKIKFGSSTKIGLEILYFSNDIKSETSTRSRAHETNEGNTLRGCWRNSYVWWEVFPEILLAKNYIQVLYRILLIHSNNNVE